MVSKKIYAEALAERDKLKERLQEFHATLVVLEDTNSELDEKVKELEGRNKKLSNSIIEYIQDNQSNIISAPKLRTRIKDLETHNDYLVFRNLYLEEQIEVGKKDVDALETKIEDMYTNLTEAVKLAGYYRTILGWVVR